jgi:heme-degrading monooxygenase HmoA
MIARIWRTEIDPARAHEYRDFARAKSLPMFRAQPGFAGVLFAARGAERHVITLWADRASAEALERASAYRSTVAEIETTRFLRGPSAVEMFELEDHFIDPAAMRADEGGGAAG